MMNRIFNLERNSNKINFKSDCDDKCSFYCHLFLVIIGFTSFWLFAFVGLGFKGKIVATSLFLYSFI